MISNNGKNIKRITAVFMVLFVMLSASCMKGTSGKENRVTVSAMTIEFNSGKSNTGEYADEVLRRIEDYCGCNLEITWVANELMAEKAALVMASPATMPMIMTFGGSVTADIVSAARDGLFVDLNQYIWDTEKYPNLSQILPQIADSLTVDGKLIAIPRSRVYGRYGLCYRTDWAEKLNIPEPSTPEAVYNMLYEFTYLDPDGNGIDDTIGLEMTSYTGVFDIIQTWFGCGNGWTEVDDRLIPVHLQEEYITALDYIRRLYKEGLMPKDWAARPTDTWSNGCKFGENGVFIDVMDSGRRIWDYFASESTFTPSVVNPEEPASMTLYGAVNGRTLATSGYNGFFVLSAATCDTTEKIEAALTFLDRLCDDEMLVLTQYGLEGINYNIEEGYIVRLDENNAELAHNYAGFNQLLAYLPSAEHVTEPHVQNTARVDAQNEAYAAAREKAVQNPASTYLLNSPTYANVGTSLQEMIDNARNEFICGEITKPQLLEVNNMWLSSGGQQIINEVNDMYQANKQAGDRRK